MSGVELSIWVSLMLLGFAGSAIYSGLETGAYSLNRVRLHILAHQHKRSAVVLRRLLDNPSVLLSTLLIGNNVTNYLGTAGLTTILDHWGYEFWELLALNTLVSTTVLFVFGETLPKDLFAAHADRLMYPLARLLQVSQWVFAATGLTWVVGFFSHVVMRTLGHGGRVNPFHPRRQVEVLVKEGVGYGLLSDEQSAIVERVLSLAERRVEDEMVPWDAVITIGEGASADELWDLADRTSRSRLPAVNASGRVIGVVNVIDALLLGREGFPGVRALALPAAELPGSMPMRTALGEMQQRHEALAIVVDAARRPMGVVTVKDLVEPITGELSSW